MKLHGCGMSMKIGKLADKSVSGIRELSDESCRFDIDGPNGTRRLPPDHITQNFQIPAWRNRKRHTMAPSMETYISTHGAHQDLGFRLDSPLLGFHHRSHRPLISITF